MLRTLLRQVRQYKWAAILTPVWTTAEVVMEVLIPYVTASIIDKGINAGNIGNVYRYGLSGHLSECGGRSSRRR